MSWKLILAALAVFCLSVIGAYKLGAHLQHKADVVQCNTDRGLDKQAYQAAQTTAVELAAKAQKAADAVALVETQRLLGLAQTAAVTAQKTASEAKARADSLTQAMKRLSYEDPSVKAWSDTCLPASLLRSLHGAEGTTAAGTCQ